MTQPLVSRLDGDMPGSRWIPSPRTKSANLPVSFAKPSDFQSVLVQYASAEGVICKPNMTVEIIPKKHAPMFTPLSRRPEA